MQHGSHMLHGLYNYYHYYNAEVVFLSSGVCYKNIVTPSRYCTRFIIPTKHSNSLTMLVIILSVILKLFWTVEVHRHKHMYPQPTTLDTRVPHPTHTNVHTRMHARTHAHTHARTHTSSLVPTFSKGSTITLIFTGIV